MSENFTITFEENKGSILETVIHDAMAEYFRNHPAGDITQEEIGALINGYLENHPIEGGVTTEEVNAAIEDYFTENPVVGEKGEKGDKGDKGDTGAGGKSAYELAVQNGFSGTISEWLASLKGAKGDKGDSGDGTSNIFSPDDDGAVGNGVADDSAHFPIGDYIYNLTEGKTYAVNKGKFVQLDEKPVIGGGTIKCTIPNTYSNPNGDNVFYHDSKPAPNRFLECVEHVTHAHTYNTNIGNANFYNGKGMGRFLKEQGSIKPNDRKGHFHNIGAIYHDYDHEADIPNQFTVCIGRSIVWVKSKNSSKWRKIVDELPPKEGVLNYRLPWGETSTREGDEARPFTNPVQIVDNDHLEVVVNKEEMLTWLGTDPDGFGGCVHFWSNNYFFSDEESATFDDFISYWEIWIKEASAAKYFQFSTGIDTTNRDEYIDGVKVTKNHPLYFFVQAIMCAQMPITTQKTVYWGTSLNIDEARKIDFDALQRDLAVESWGTTGKGYDRTTNLLCPKPFTETVDGYTLSYDDKTEEFTLDIALAEGQNAGIKYIDLTPHLRRLPPVKAGEVITLYIEYLDSGAGVANQGTLAYGNNHAKIFGMIDGVSRYNGISKKAFAVEADMDVNGLWFRTRDLSAPVSRRFRMWIVKDGEVGTPSLLPYESPYKPEWVLADNVVDRYLESKVDTTTAELKQMIADLQTRIVALENPS